MIVTSLLIYLIIYIRDKMRFTLHTNMANFVGFNMLDISVFFSEKDDILNKIRIALIHLKKKMLKDNLKNQHFTNFFFF